MKSEQKLQAYVEKFNTEHTELYRQRIPDADAAAWMKENIPLFECDDPTVEETYYFRFWTFRKHIKDTPEGTVLTEFLPQVPWSGPYNTISCAIGHHVAEARWLRDASVIESDIRFFLKEELIKHATTYTSSFMWNIYQYILHSGKLDLARELLPKLMQRYSEWEAKRGTEYGLFWSHDGFDGMELSISGHGLRPTLNTYLYGAAIGISRLCEAFGDPHAEEYAQKAIALREKINTKLWDEKARFYKTVPMDSTTAVPDFDRADPNRNVREEIGFIPFSVPTLCDEAKEEAFTFLTDPQVFAAPCGITTADQSHPLFMKNPVHHECLWDGPVWPYATAQTLTALYTLLTEKESKYIGKTDFMKLLWQYADSQKLYVRGKAVNWIDENLDPYTGQWIARDLIYLDHAYQFPKERGAEYNHSTFCDLVLSGACGIHADTDLGSGCRTLRVRPLSAGTWKYFSVENLSFDGSLFSICYDADGSRYGYASPLTLLRDGKVVASGTSEINYTF